MAKPAMLAFMGGLMGTLWYFFIKQWRKPLTPPIRFNRQRREVCITEPDGSYWFVPWERVYAIAPSVTNLCTYGATKHGSLLLWFPLKGQEHQAYGLDKKGWVLMVNPGGGITSMAQWKCIRSFMEIGTDAVPDSSHAERSSKVEQQGYLGVWRGLFGQFFDELKAKEYGAAFSAFTGLTIFGCALDRRSTDQETRPYPRPHRPRSRRVIQTSAARAMGQTLT